MIKVLIMCKKLENAKKILNNIVRKIYNLQLVGIANSYDEAKGLLIENEADIIITTDQKMINFIRNEFITYIPGIIIIDNIPDHFNITDLSVCGIGLDIPRIMIFNKIRKFFILYKDIPGIDGR